MRIVKNISILSTAVMACTIVANANAISINKLDFADVSSFTLVGSTTNSSDYLSLTQTTGQAGAAYYNTRIGTQLSNGDNISFSSSFKFQITDPSGSSDNDGQGADGFSFILNGSDKLLGGAGGGIGYSGIDNSLAIEFDTWNNGFVDGGNGNHIGINLDGDLNSEVRSNYNKRLNDGDIWSAWIDYNGIDDLLSVRLSDGNDRPATALLSYQVDLTSFFNGSDILAGFTSGTGAAGGNHKILEYQFDASQDSANVPEPSSLMLSAFGLLGFCFFQKKKNQELIARQKA